MSPSTPPPAAATAATSPSAPTGEERADVVVVGSGFGGAVAAARLAQAGLDVVVLERGRRWEPGSFPRRPDLAAGWLWQKGGGLYDVRWLDRMLSVQAAGWGGGSLAYANVFARPSAITVAERWPASLSRGELDPYYDLAAHMLQVSPVQPDPRTGRVPDRTPLAEGAKAHFDQGRGTVRPLLAVTFGDDVRTLRPNRHGVPQRACHFCGDCVIGCNHGAKNTLDLNYLAVAERAGARARTHAEVERVAPVAGGYRVTYRDPRSPHQPPRGVVAASVFLAAGAVGTTELLLRARDVHRTLPELSARLGEGFSGNGDFLAFLRMRSRELDLVSGPTITTTSILDVPEGGRRVWYQVQDGNVPEALSGLVDAMLPLPRLRAAVRRLLGGPRPVLPLLLMGQDAAEGRLYLDHQGEAALHWDNRLNRQLYRSEARIAPTLGRLLRARVLTAPTWTLMRRAVTVHNLGGVPQGEDSGGGVIAGDGQVHGYPGLFVVDGSTIPAATGVNPSATILAAAERTVEGAVRRLTGEVAWRAPEWDDVVPVQAPEDVATVAMSQWRQERAGDGIAFRELLRGARSRTAAGTPPWLRLEARLLGLDPFFADDAHHLDVSGEFSSGTGPPRPVRGRLSLFPAGGGALMRYELRTDDSGPPLELRGTKVLPGAGPLSTWRGLTCLDVEVGPGQGSDSHAGGTTRMQLRITPAQVARLLTSLRSDGFTRPRRVRALLRFAAFFAGRTVTAVATHVPSPPAPRRSTQRAGDR